MENSSENGSNRKVKRIGEWDENGFKDMHDIGVVTVQSMKPGKKRKTFW